MSGVSQELSANGPVLSSYGWQYGHQSVRR